MTSTHAGARSLWPAHFIITNDTSLGLPFVHNERADCPLPALACGASEVELMVSQGWVWPNCYGWP